MTNFQTKEIITPVITVRHPNAADDHYINLYIDIYGDENIDVEAPLSHILECLAADVFSEPRNNFSFQLTYSNFLEDLHEVFPRRSGFIHLPADGDPAYLEKILNFFAHYNRGLLWDGTTFKFTLFTADFFDLTNGFFCSRRFSKPTS
ncbi:hypothetical protein [Rhizobium sp. Root1203]|uniref:hypothetical protein n=1 Tax=Rhizobium sp. Root1203 TaxID=1736427 RepID=UPI000AF6C9B2|nr:hypothetical protein [Rhizobium sp. Root1203]